MPSLGLAAGLAMAADEASMGEDDVCARLTACSNSNNARRDSINRIVDPSTFSVLFCRDLRKTAISGIRERRRFGLCCGLRPMFNGCTALVVESANLGHFHETVLGRHELPRKGSIVLSPPKFF